MSVSAALRKFRELQRDLLYLRYGDEWPKHERVPGGFWAPPSAEEREMLERIGQPSAEEREMLERIGQFAEGGESTPKS